MVRTSTVPSEPAGRLVDVGDGKRHALIRGRTTTAPTVVFESGLASPLQTWSWVQESLAADTRTISYERAGCGWSDTGKGPRSIPRLAEDLDRVLDGLEVNEPVVLVAHSFGGLVARRLADTRPERVAGVLFVDAMHPEELRRSATQRRGTAWLEQSLKVSALKAMTGFGKRQIDERFTDLPPTAAQHARSRLHVGAMWRSAAAELVSWKNADPAELVTGRFPRGAPVGVVISGESLRNDVAHRKLQDELLQLSDQSFASVVREASHFGLLLAQEWAAAVTKATRDVLGLVAGVPASGQQPVDKAQGGGQGDV
ncbi:alpha/beta hydrolase [Amycolatopsis antarctica]|uniref:Alpha/beta hydrolase n=1 Tax=Amycolatopsis antarctica TaxID=1854586 RepID=A0A263D2Z3_9PSEU|nr:alpha/beta hydrolase [Amycolatopsis antarctica]OZM72833.1 alpha/beta hydrolase [Amycolatopsis antarctica]